MTYTIAIANLKGGVAKTTSTASLAGAFNNLGYNVLVADLDAQANLTSAFGMKPAESKQSILDVFFNWSPLSGARISTSTPRIDLVPAHPDLVLAERFLPVRKNFDGILRQAISRSDEYDFILLDCPPFLGAVTLNALNAADLLIIPTVPEVFSWESLLKTTRYAEKVIANTNPNLKYHILICILDARLRIHREITQQYHQRFGDQLLHTVIQVDTKLRESAVAGVPINQYEPNTRSARQYHALAQEISEKVHDGFLQSVRKQNIQLES